MAEVTTYTDQEMLDITRAAIVELTIDKYAEVTGADGRSSTTHRLQELRAQERDYRRAVTRAVRPLIRGASVS